MGCLSSVSPFSCVVSCPSFFSCYSPSRLQSQGAVPFVSCSAGKRGRGERTWLAGGQANTADCPRACRISLIDSPPSQPASHPRFYLETGGVVHFVDGLVVIEVLDITCYPAFRRGDGGGGGGGGMWNCDARTQTAASARFFLLLLPLLRILLQNVTLPVSVSLSNLQAAPAPSVGNSSTDQQGKGGTHPTQAVTVVVVVVVVVFVVIIPAGGRGVED
ncbi:hypothetical protein LY76DRAFT_595205 [Colletotrichum caudatum]|nr:hypothetical protein LY76DRAFT_595205 [Colletotrichum caudatum]